MRCATCASETSPTRKRPCVAQGRLPVPHFKIDASTDNGAPSGVYVEQGREVFVGSLNGGPDGLFATTYKFESKWDPDVTTGHEVEGR